MLFQQCWWCNHDIHQPTPQFDGLDQLTHLGYEVGWLWYDILALALFSTLFLIIAHLALLLIKKK